LLDRSMGVGLHANLRMCECIDESLGGVYMLHLIQVLVGFCSCSCTYTSPLLAAKPQPQAALRRYGIPCGALYSRLYAILWGCKQPCAG